LPMMVGRLRNGKGLSRQGGTFSMRLIELIRTTKLQCLGKIEISLEHDQKDDLSRLYGYQFQKKSGGPSQLRQTGVSNPYHQFLIYCVRIRISSSKRVYPWRGGEKRMGGPETRRRRDPEKSRKGECTDKRVGRGGERKIRQRKS